MENKRRIRNGKPGGDEHPRPQKATLNNLAPRVSESENYFRVLAEESPNMIFINQNGLVVYANKKCEELMGYTIKEITSPAFNFMTLILPSSIDRIRDSFQKHALGVDVPSYEYSLVTKTGAIIEAIITTKIIKYHGTNAILGIVTDITERKHDEMKLRESESQLRQVIDLVPHFIFAKNRSGKFILANDAVAQTYGTTVEKLIGKTDYDFNANTNEVTGFIRDDNEVMDTRQPKDVAEEIITRYDGSKRILHTVKIPYQLAQTQEDAILGVSIDITERKQAEKKLEQSERNYREIFNATSEAIFLHDATTGHMLDINNMGLRIFGFDSKEEMIAAIASGNLSDGSLYTHEKALQLIHLAVEQGPQVFEWLARKKNDEVFWVEISLRSTQISGEKRVLAVVRDITERKRNEENLRESEKRFRTTLDSMLEGCQIIGLDWTYLYINDAAEKHNRRTKGELLGRRYTDVWPGIEKTKFFPSLKRCLEDRVPLQMENEFVFPNGDIGWFDLSIQPVPEGVFILSVDITEQKLAEKTSLLNEEMYRTIFENTGTATIIIEADTLISLTNKEFENLSGYSKDEVEGKKKWTEFVSPADVEFMLGQHNLRREHHDAALNNYEFRFIDKYKNIHDIYLSIDIIIGTKKSIASLLDITESKRAAKEIQKSEERFRSLVQHSADIITIHDQDMKIKYATPSITKTLGYTPEELIGKSPLDLTHPDDIMTISNEIQLTLNYQNPGIPTEFRVKHADGSWVVLESVSNNQLLNPNISGIIVTSRDISEKKRTQLELQQLNDRLHALAANLQHVREEESARIAREIHDELGQLLTGVKMDLAFLDELLANQSAPHARNEIVERMKSTSNLTDRAIQSMRKITSELRPAILDTMGLSAAIEWQLEEFQKRTGIHCSYFPRTNPTNIDETSATAIFRILQESLSNIVRHAKATNVIITFDQNVSEITLEIQDDGQGIKSRDITKEKSFGILGMQERAWLLGGSFSIDERINGGTIIRVQIPIHPHNQNK